MMSRENTLAGDQQSLVLPKWVGIALLILLGAGIVLIFVYYTAPCIDGCGPYHNTASAVDLDGDGDLDVLLSSLRHELETIFWAGSTVWLNQGGEKFTSQVVDYGGPSTAAGDIDGDGDADIVRLDYGATLYLNQGGRQGGKTGDFTTGESLTPRIDPHNWSTPGSVVIGDLNNDDRLDVLVSYCCSMLIENPAGGAGFEPFLPWIWLNVQESRNLTSLGDLPMRPTLGDLDGDGDLDIYAASLPPKGAGYDPADRVLLNDGSASFLDSGQRLQNPRLPGAAGSGSVALGDLDGDGDLDALVATAKGAAVWINQGGSQGGKMGFLAETRQRLGKGHIEAAFLADLDADGDLDGIAAGKEQASIWWNDGSAGFRATRTSASAIQSATPSR